MLKDGPLGDAQGNGNIADSRRVISMLGKVKRGGLDDAAALRLGTGTHLALALV